MEEAGKGIFSKIAMGSDHDPFGKKLERRAIQIGLRNNFIQSFAKEDIILIEDISDFVREQHYLVLKDDLESLMIPYEKPLTFKDQELNRKLKLNETGY